VYLSGGGNSAAQHPCISRRCEKSYDDRSRRHVKRKVSAYLVDRIYSTKNVEVLTNTEVVALIGNRSPKQSHSEIVKTGEENVKTRWLFVCIGGSPHADGLRKLELSRSAGYLVTGRIV